MQTAFLSYSHADHAFAQSLAARLQTAGVDLFFDQWDLKVGDLLLDRIVEAISKRDYVIALISKASIRSRWVKEEISAAFEKGERAILPVILPGTEQQEIPLFLRTRIYADFRHNEAKAFQSLLRVLVPDAQIMKEALDPFGKGRMLILVGTSTSLYQYGSRYSDAPAGSTGAEFAFRGAIQKVIGQGRELLANYPNAMRLQGLKQGDNVFCIGSPKVNRFTAGFLAQCVREPSATTWFVGRQEWRSNGLYYALKGQKAVYRPTIDRINGHGTGLDFGLIIWVGGLLPHNGHTVIAAGCHTAATHASADAAVSPETYRELRKHRTIAGQLDSRSGGGFWAIISVRCKDFSPDLSSITIVESGALSLTKIDEAKFSTEGSVTWDGNEYSGRGDHNAIPSSRDSESHATIDPAQQEVDETLYSKLGRPTPQEYDAPAFAPRVYAESEYPEDRDIQWQLYIRYGEGS